jgi:hypothetical protein
MATDIATALAIGQVGQAGQSARTQRALAERLMGGATAGRPVYSPWAALAQGLTGGVGGYMAADADEKEQEARRNAIAEALSGQERRQQAQRDEVAGITMGNPVPDGMHGPARPALQGDDRINALAALAPNNPAAAAQLGVDQIRDQRSFQERQAAEQRTFQERVAAAQRAHAAALAARPQLPPGYRLTPAGTAERIPGLPADVRAPISVAPGATLVDPVTGRPVFAAPERPVPVAPGGALVDPQTGRIVTERAPAEQAPRSPERLEQDLRVAGAGRPSVEVRTGQSFGDRIAELGARRLDEQRGAVTQAAEALRSAARVQSLIDDGVISGTGANARLAIEQALRTAGVVDGNRVPSTQVLMAELAQNTLGAAGGLSGPTSDRDILFLREIVAGNINLDAATIRRVTAIAAERSGRVLDGYNRLAQEFGQIPDIPPFLRQMYAPIERPTGAAAPGQGAPQVIEYDAQGRRVTR